MTVRGLFVPILHPAVDAEHVLHALEAIRVSSKDVLTLVWSMTMYIVECTHAILLRQKKSYRNKFSHYQDRFCTSIRMGHKS